MRFHNPKPGDDIANVSFVTRTSGESASGLYFLSCGAFPLLYKRNINYYIVFVFISYISVGERSD